MAAQLGKSPFIWELKKELLWIRELKKEQLWITSMAVLFTLNVGYITVVGA